MEASPNPGPPHQQPPMPRLDAPGGPALITLERLKQYPLFSKLPDTILNKLVLHVREERYRAGTLILRAGTYNSDAYYIAKGVIEIRMPTATSKAVVRPAPSRSANPKLLDRLVGMLGLAGAAGSKKPAAAPEASPKTRPPLEDRTVVLADMPVDLKASNRAVLQPGEIFGESSAISRYPVSTDVVAVSDTLCLLISGYALKTILSKAKEMADFYKSVQERYRTRTLGTHLRQISLFADLSEELVARIVQSAKFESFDPVDLLKAKGEREEAKRNVMAGTSIVKQGTDGNTLYLVVGGHVKVSVQTGAADLAVTYLRKGDYAGELCLLMDEPWPFSLSALEHVELVMIARADVEAIVASSADAERELWNTAVKRLKQRGFALRNPQASRQLQMAMDTGLIHGESVLLIDLSTCTRCDDCVRACAETHEGTPRFIREGLRYEKWSVVDGLLPVHRPGLHGELSNRRDHAGAGNARGHHQRRQVRRLRSLRARVVPGTTSRWCQTRRRPTSSRTIRRTRTRTCCRPICRRMMRSGRRRRASSSTWRRNATCVWNGMMGRRVSRCVRTGRPSGSPSRIWRRSTPR